MSASATRLTADSASRSHRHGREWLLRIGPYGSILLGLSAVLLIWLGVFYFSHGERVQTERAAAQNASNLSRAFEEQIIRSIRAADQTLLYMRDSYARDPQHFDVSPWTRSQFLSDFNIQVVLIDKRGIMLASNIPGAAPGLDLSDREHFQVHAARETDELFISKPIFGRVSDRWSVQVTRRITMPDGSFGGVVVVSLDPNYLAQFYQSIDLGERGAAVLLGTDGVVRAAGGGLSEGRPTLGASLHDGLIFSEFALHKDGVIKTISRFDGLERIISYRQVSGYPLIVTVAFGVDEVLAAYRRNLRSQIALAALLTVWVLAVSALIVRYQRVLAAARDAAEAGTRSRSEFLAMISHEIRTPMTGVIGAADLLLGTRLDAEQVGFARTVRDSATHLLRIINDVLDFSKLEADRVEIEKIPFDLHGLVRDTVGLLAARAREKGLRLTTVVAADVPRAIVGDPARLRQILLNLVGNGLKFTKQGGVTVTVSVEPAGAAPQARLAFSVADTGIGIPDDAVSLLFREFSQLDSSIARRFGGTGLGLAICKRLVGLLGGTITVESEVGKGTTFRFTIGYAPASLSEAADFGVHELPAGAEPPASPAPPPRKSCRILLAEDNLTNQEVAAKLIERLGYSVDLAANGVEAVAACSAKAYDLVFMDIMMPELDGLAATRAIRKLDPPFSRPRIVAFTANAQKHDMTTCLAAGMDDFMTKPVTRGGLAAKLAWLQDCDRAPRQTTTGHDTATCDAASFDEPVYAELVDALGADDARVVLETFLTDTPRRLEAMRADAEKGDNASVKCEVHALKSAAATLGFPHLSRLAGALAAEALSLDRPALDARIAAIASEFARVDTVARTGVAARPAEKELTEMSSGLPAA